MTRIPIFLIKQLLIYLVLNLYNVPLKTIIFSKIKILHKKRCKNTYLIIAVIRDPRRSTPASIQLAILSSVTLNSK